MIQEFELQKPEAVSGIKIIVRKVGIKQSRFFRTKKQADEYWKPLLKKGYSISIIELD